MFDAEDVQDTAFRGRIQHFRKCKLPERRVGKGARHRYSADDVFQLVLAFEFAELGVDPSLIIQVIRRHWRAQTGLWAAIANAQRFPDDDILVVIEANFMSYAWNREKSKPTATEMSVQVVAEPILIRYFKEARDRDALLKTLRQRGKRYFVLNLSERVRAVEKELGHKGK